MQREAESYLKSWKNDPYRLPLIVRGARQVGKSHLIESFGKQYFSHCLIVNFELQSQYKACFDGELEPKTIISQIELLSNQRCIPGQTLLFLDEIQECPRAILSLRYFKEKFPKLHVIAAGSLLEFTLAETDFRFPVGRVSFLYLKPLSFKEFLLNAGQQQLNELLTKVTFESKYQISPIVHERLLEFVRQYYVLGGMPAVVKSFLETNSFLPARRLKQFLVQSYIQDFGKYATRAQQRYLQKLISVSPALVGKQFKYSSVDRDMNARELKVALEQLTWAQVLSVVHATTASGLPLNLQAKEHKFKILFVDIGLMNQSFNIEEQLILKKETSLLHWGNLAEQFVGQELLAYQPNYQSAEVYYWKRENRGALAEIDYLTVINGVILPIEVKAGMTGRLKSLAMFIKEKSSPFGIQISERQLAFKNSILTVPFYLIHQLERLVQPLLSP